MKAERLEGEKRKFQEFHLQFKAERRRLIGELELQLKDYVVALAERARVHNMRMEDAQLTSRQLNAHLNSTEATFKGEVEELTKQHLHAISSLQSDYIAQAHHAEDKKDTLQ